jgi:hypothetical protein
MAVTVSRFHTNDFIVSTWFHGKAGDDAITCSMNIPSSKERILDYGCSFVLRGSGTEKEICRDNYQESHTEYKAGDVINHRYPAEITVTSLEDDSVWCYVCDKDSSKVITGESLFVTSTGVTCNKKCYIVSPHEMIEVDGETLKRNQIKEVDPSTIIKSEKDIYIATFTYN